MIQEIEQKYDELLGNYYKEIESFGWKEFWNLYSPFSLKGIFKFEKENYWLTLDTREHYVGHPFIELTIRDPVLESEKVGDNRGTYWFAFIYKGPETLEQLDKLLTF